MSVSWFSVSLLAIGVANALPSGPSFSNYAVKERHIVPRAWTSVGAASGDETVHLQIGLRQSNPGAIEQHLLEISNPAHARYGQHMSGEEVDAIVAPSADTIDLVSAWLEEHDITDHFFSSAKDWVHVVLPIEKVESMLQTKYESYRHSDGSYLSRAKEWSLPQHLHEHIDVVQPTTSFLNPQRRATTFDSHLGEPVANSWWEAVGKQQYGPGASSASRGNISKICNESFTTPECIRTLYGTIDYKPQVPGKNHIGLTNFLNETNNRNDVRQFLELYRPEAASAADAFEIVIIDNAPNPQGAYTAEQIADGTNIEADLDAEQILSIGYPTPLTAYSTGGSPPFVPDLSTPTDTNEPYLAFQTYFLSQSTLPQTLSISYGDDEQTVPLSYATRVCSNFAQFGVRGVSVLISSGDSGVGSNGTCYSNTDPAKAEFLPEFPTGCPWVTSVGATKAFQPEVAVSRFASGAGFSNYFGQPSYQAAAVDAYIASLNGLHDGLYNKSGRAYPDVAAQGNHDALVWNSIVRTVGGTSASAPTFAAVISLVNDALLAAGRPQLGFLNPWLYGGAYKALTDITSGNSYGCNTTGFPAAKGWDAVTGFGTPNFRKLVKAAFKKEEGSGGYGYGKPPGGYGGAGGGYGGGW